MKKIIIVCLCAVLLLALPFTSLAAQPRQLVPDDRQGVPTPDNGDPDGPTKGFLDDPTDWRYLVKGIFYYTSGEIDLFAVLFGFFNLTPDSYIFDIDNFQEYINELTDYLTRTFDNMTVEKQMILILLFAKTEAEAMISFACFIEAFDFWDFDKDGC